MNLTFVQAAKVLRISAAEIRQLVEDKKIFVFPKTRRGSYIPAEAIDAYLRGDKPRAFVAQMISEQRATRDGNTIAKDLPKWLRRGASSGQSSPARLGLVLKSRRSNPGLARTVESSAARSTRHG